MAMNKAVFLDRDGVINEDRGYVHKIEDFVFIDGIFEKLKKYQNDGYLLIVVTNQSGIGRGYYSEEDFLKLTKYMLDEFEKKGIKITKVYHSPYRPEDNAMCRKPNPGMLLKAKEEFDIDMKNSIMIGDKQSDMQAGKNAGVGKLILIKNR